MDESSTPKYKKDYQRIQELLVTLKEEAMEIQKHHQAILQYHSSLKDLNTSFLETQQRLARVAAVRPKSSNQYSFA